MICVHLLRIRSKALKWPCSTWFSDLNIGVLVRVVLLDDL
jgi:hypothetical protein